MDTTIDPADWKYYHPIARGYRDIRVGDAVSTSTGEVGVVTEVMPNPDYMTLVSYAVGANTYCTFAPKLTVVERRDTVWVGFQRRETFAKLCMKCSSRVRASWNLIASGQFEEAIATAEECEREYKEQREWLEEPFFSNICQLIAVAHLGLGNYEQAADHARGPLGSYPSGIHSFLYELALQGQGKLSPNRVEKWIADPERELAQFDARRYAATELERLKTKPR